MTTITLTLVDWLIIAVYFAFVLGIGFYLKRFTKTQEDFFMAGRKNSAWVAGLAFLSANLGALELLGMTGNTFKYGMYVAHFYWIGAIPAMLFLGIYMMPFYYSSRIHSVPGYLKLRFDEKTRVLNAIAFARHDPAGVGHQPVRDGAGAAHVPGLELGRQHVGLGRHRRRLRHAERPDVGDLHRDHPVLPDLVRPVPGVDVWASSRSAACRRSSRAFPTAFATLWSTSGDPTQNGMADHLGRHRPRSRASFFPSATGPRTFLSSSAPSRAKDLRSARMTPIIASFFKMAVPFLVIITGLVALVLARDPGSGFALLQDGGQVNYDSALPLLIAAVLPEPA